MSKITLTNLVNLENQTTAVNAVNTNNAVISAAFDNTLSLDGTSPNQMGSYLDMNSNQILNLPNPATTTSPLRLQDLNTFIGGGTISSLPAGGTESQVLAKNSSVSYDVSWQNSAGQVVDTLTALKAITPGSTTNVIMRGYYAVGDGGGGSFYWSSSSVATDNGGSIIQPTVAGTGRWIRIYNEGKVNVKSFGAKGDGVTTDTTAVNNALLFAIANKYSLYFPASSNAYLCTITIPDGTQGLSILGDIGSSTFTTGPEPIGTTVPSGSYITSASSIATLNMVSATMQVTNIFLQNLKFYNTGTGDAIHMFDLAWIICDNVVAYATGGGAGFNIQGVGPFRLDTCQGYGFSGPAIKIDNGGGTITNSGPSTITNCTFEIAGGSSPAIVMQGDNFDINFLNTNTSACYGSMPCTVQIDGYNATPSGCVTFDGCHSEYVYNTSNTGVTYLIGNTTKFGTVVIKNEASWGHGDGVHYQTDFVKVVAAKNVIVKNITAGLPGSTGFTRSAVRLETTFPVSGDMYTFENIVYYGSGGTVYSDANSTIQTGWTGRATNLNAEIGLSQNGTSEFFINNPNVGTSAVASYQAGNGNGLVGFSVAGANYSNTLLQNKGFVNTTSGLSGLALVTSGTNPIVFGTNGVETSRFSGSTPGLLTLGVAGTSVGKLALSNATSGTVALQPTTGALGSSVITFPAITDTMVGVAATQTLTNKTLTSPTLTTPALGTPSSGTLTSCTGLPISTGVSGLGTGVATALAAVPTGSGAVVLANTPTLITPNVGAATGTSLTLTGGNLTFATSGDGHVGTATNDNANAGVVGEYISSTLASGSAISLTASIGVTLTSITLTAGDWDICGDVIVSGAATTNFGSAQGGIGVTTNTMDYTVGNFAALQYGSVGIVPGAGNPFVMTLIPVRKSIATTTTFYLIGLAAFSVSTASAYGMIRARRVR